MTLTRPRRGTATKVALRYRSRVWETAGFSGDTFTDLSVSTTWEATNGQPGPDAVLLAGEHTAQLSGYMESALRSGRRAARLVARRAAA
ncbi:MAG: hypothetical protein JWN65_1825 [Solirubrobacterales bacterium]|nr:hypothetical protein [Solirubrobacterales bacterium]